MMQATLPDTLFSWQVTPWRQLWQTQQQNRLAHALLFVGIDGLGKKQFAETLAQSLLCQNPSEAGRSCGTCSSCHLITAKSHPDLLWVSPQEDAKSITVDQIRHMVHTANETTMQGGYRIVIIHPAAAMNVNAANALLKTLEEPTPNTVIILISDQGLRLPATITSRCQKIAFSPPSHEVAVTWLRTQLPNEKVDPQLLLKLANGAPLKALSWIEKDIFAVREDLYKGMHALSAGELDPLHLAVKWQELDQVCVIDLLLSWLTDLLRYKLTQDPARVANQDYQKEIAKISVGMLKNNLLAYIDDIQEKRTHVLASLNLNKQLMLEDVLIRWTHYVSR